MGEKVRILVIDDERLLVKSTAMALRLRGYDAVEALDGPSGITAALEEKPDLILLDIMMPGMDGWQVLQQLREKEETGDIPILVFTAKEYSNGTTVADLNGADGFVPKPFELEDLIESIEAKLTRKSE
jgi:DNA-binding response OmpR family regulator